MGSPDMPATSKVKKRVEFENIAFRGASGLAPENTLRACDFAIRKGASIVSLDVRISADGYPVLFRDEDLSRKTNGKGSISKLPLREIRKLRIKGGRGRRIYEEPISTLEEAILLTRDRADLALELMGTEETQPELAEKVVELIRKYSLPNSTVVFTHDPAMLKKLRAMRPHFRLGRTLGPRAGWEKVVEAIREHPHVLMMHRGAASGKVMTMCREARIKVWIYTVEHQKEFQRALTLRPEGVMTLYPGRLRRFLERQTS